MHVEFKRFVGNQNGIQQISRTKRSVQNLQPLKCGRISNRRDFNQFNVRTYVDQDNNL